MIKILKSLLTLNSSIMRNNYSINWLIPRLDRSKCSRQIEEFIIREIRSRNLHAGDPVPSSRQLAKINQVSASSVRRAYVKLTDNNWLTSNPGSGTVVSANNPTEDMQLRTSGFTEHFPAGLVLLNKKQEIYQPAYVEEPYIAVGTDFPSPAAFPENKFSEYCNHFREESRKLSQARLLNEYDARYLKDNLVNYLNRRRGFGLKNNMLDIIKARKSALDRVFKILISPGDVVINTSPHDTKLSDALLKCNANVFTINRKDPDFMDRIAQLLSHTKVRAIHIRPQCSIPESFTLDEDSCRRLVQLAKDHRMCIIEEEDDHEFWYGITAYKPLACYDHDGYVIYMAALSKATSDTQSLRIIVASAQFITELQALPAQAINERDVIKEKAFAEMILKGDMADYARQVRIQSKTYRDELNLILNHYLNKFISYVIPEHGLTYWLKFDEGFDLNVMLKKLDDNGIPVPYHPNNQKTSIKTNFMVLGFGAFDINEAEGGAKMLGMVMSGNL